MELKGSHVRGHKNLFIAYLLPCVEILLVSKCVKVTNSASDMAGLFFLLRICFQGCDFVLIPVLLEHSNHAAVPSGREGLQSWKQWHSGRWPRCEGWRGRAMLGLPLCQAGQLWSWLCT